MTMRKIKLIVVGGFGAGKTTMVGALSDIAPVQTEELLTTASVHTDVLTPTSRKSATTVSFDFGRRQITNHDTLFLFGFPGQERFRHMWAALAQGAIGAVVLADTRQLRDCWEPLAFVEEIKLPFIVGINQFPDSVRYPIDEVRDALDIDYHHPIMECRADNPHSATDVVVALLQHMKQTLLSNPT